MTADNDPTFADAPVQDPAAVRVPDQTVLDERDAAAREVARLWAEHPAPQRFTDALDRLVAAYEGDL